ncbi:MAG TPA: YbgF trimerization domain-containing protein [Agitococcus sp.]|nr:YbgF trimerization domain-containing protein [Agitococcus sp.]HNG09721.1 YbgF trimerization domain-containing protein [Agitococcus sp.]
MRKITVSLLSLAISHVVYAADIVIEEKSLSQPKTQAAPVTKPIQAQALSNEVNPSLQWQLYQQVQQLQQEVRDLRGQLEVQANIIERMKQDARSRYLDLDQRITDLKNRPQPEVANTTPSTTPTATTTTTTTTVNAATATNPTTATPTTEATTATTPPVVNPDDDKRAYFAAYQTFKTGGPNKAINPMRNFIKTYPQSTFIPSAYYWLGEFYLAASPADVNNAKKSFRIVVDNYADAPKAASAMLKLASFADVDGKTQDAVKLMLRIVKEFPKSEEATAARAYLSAQNVAIPEEKKAKPSTTKSELKDNKKVNETDKKTATPAKKEDSKTKTP